MIPSLAVGRGIPKPDANGWYVESEHKPNFDEFVWMKRTDKVTRMCPYTVGRYRRVDGKYFWMSYLGNVTVYDVTHWKPIDGPVE